MLTPSTVGDCDNPAGPTPPAILAVVKIRITDDTTGSIVGGAQSIFVTGQNGSISLLEAFDDAADDSSNFTLEIAVTSGTVHIQPVAQPDTESAALVVNNVAAGMFLQTLDDELAVDFSTASVAFVPLLVVTMTPTAGTSIQAFASVNFTWTP
jgi:hypothetical protein